MTDTKNLRRPSSGDKKPGKHQRVDAEIKELRDAGIKPEETHSQDADRHQKSAHQKQGKSNHNKK